jgi:two-component system, NtrC family, sensor kinase
LSVPSTFIAEVKPFTDKQIELISNFAAQAVIAIENTRLLNELRERTGDLEESLEYQTATSNVLKVISRSASDLRKILEFVAETAARLCAVKQACIYRLENRVYRFAVGVGIDPAYREIEEGLTIVPGRETLVGRTALDGKTVHILDAWSDPHYGPKDDIQTAKVRTLLGVPLIREGEVVGVITLARETVAPFSSEQIELVRTFADQAVIAIENTRLLNELRQRTDDLTESLEQQTATSEVLQVIGSSRGELGPVFESMLERAVRLCGAKFGNLWLREGDAFLLGATHGTPRAFADYLRRARLFRMDPRVGLGQVVRTKQTYLVADVANEPTHGDKLRVATVELGGARTLIGVPLLKDGEVIGCIVIYRQEVRPFTEKQIAVVNNFAEQAVIAIENARLLNELRQRTTDLTESLEQQTATSEVLKVISTSPGELRPVFNAILDNAVRICEGHNATLWLQKDGTLRRAARHSEVPDAIVPSQPSADSVLSRALRTKQIIHIPDYLADRAYLDRDPFTVASVDGLGIRTNLIVPMLKEGEPVGAISIYRAEIRPFTEKQIDLIASFASQAVIAIENARLLMELRQRTDELDRSVGELSALGEVSQAVNSTLDLETVLSTIVAKAVQLSGTEAGAIYVFDEGQREFHLRATYGMNRDLIDALTKRHIGMDEPNVALALAQHEPIQIADLKEDAPSDVNEIILRAGYRALLVAPLLRGDNVAGLLVVRRRTAGAFPQNTVDLIKTFAAQSAVAIENARLFQNVEASLEDLRTAQDRLVQTEKLASLGQLTAGIAHEIKNPLNFVNNFSGVSVELIDELQETLGGVKVDSKTRAEIAELTDTLRGNLEKIVQHGKRADAIVKNMLLHSRQGSAEHRPVDINTIVEESLNLAYHGARAEKQGFTIVLERSFDPAAGEVDLYPQEITRVLLNLISNGLYAAAKRKGLANNKIYAPTLSAATKNLGDRVEIRIRDNGTGIPSEVKDKMFNPFFTTKPAGEGTGLGLSISHDIIVKQHAGPMEVETELGEFTEFKIVLPRTAAPLAKSGG